MPPGFGDTAWPRRRVAVHITLHPSPASRAVPRVGHSAHGPVAGHSGSVSLAWLMYSLLDPESILPLYILPTPRPLSRYCTCIDGLLMEAIDGELIYTAIYTYKLPIEAPYRSHLYDL